VDSSKAEIGHCVFFDDVLCSFRKVKAFYVMDRCFECSHYKRFEREMEKEENEFWAEIDEANRKKGLSCFCDSKPCDNETVGSCFTSSVDGFLLWVCPRFNIGRLRDGAVIKEEFLRLRKGGLV